MINLKNAHTDFIKHLKDKGRANATILAYGKDIEQLIDYLAEKGKSKADEVKTEDINAFMKKLAKENYTNKSISRKTNSTKTFFKYLKGEGHITEDPAIAVTHPKFETKPPRILSKAEYRALRDVCRTDARTAAVVEILLQTGVRISELANIHLDDIKFGKKEGDKGELLVRAQNTIPERVVPLNSAAQRAVKEYQAVRPKSRFNHLFITKTGRPLLIRNIRAVIDRYFKLAEIPNVKVNDLRHTFVAHHLKSGASLVKISKIAGHKRISTTEKYLEFTERPSEEKVELEEL